MNKQLVAFAAIFVTWSGVPALAQEVEVSSIEAQDAVRTYDRCLAKAIVRAERAETPLELQHDMSMRACERVRLSLLNASKGSEVASALDAVERVRQGYMQQSSQVKSKGDLAGTSKYAPLYERLNGERSQDWYSRQAQARETRRRSESPSR